MRVDAAQRRESIVQAARRLFAAAGGGIALDTVADAAGVGIATLYRNFESREVLVAQVALATLADLDAATREFTAQWTADPHDPTQAWHDYVLRLVDLNLGALVAALSVDLAGRLPETVRAAQEDTARLVEEALAHARAAKLVPADLRAPEFITGLGILTRPHSVAVTQAAPALPYRLIEVMVAGLKAEAQRENA